MARIVSLLNFCDNPGSVGALEVLGDELTDSGLVRG
jgi:hypothetical protein